MVSIACELRMTKRNEPNANVNYEAGRVSPSPQTPKYLKEEGDLLTHRGRVPKVCPDGQAPAHSSALGRSRPRRPR